MLKHMMDAVTEIYPHIPVCVHLDHGNEPGDLHDRDPGRLHLGDDGRLAEGRRQDPGRLGLQCRRHQDGDRHGPSRRHLGGRRARRARLSLETGEGEKEDGHGAEGKLSHDQLLTNPDEAVKFVKETKVDALAIAMGTSHGAYKFSAQAGRQGAGDERDRGNPPQDAERASGDARLVLGAAGAAGHHQRSSAAR
jgi:fructose-bisphosphate aldolase class II